MASWNLISHVCESRKFVLAILHWKQGLLCDKEIFHSLTRLVSDVLDVDVCQTFAKVAKVDCMCVWIVDTTLKYHLVMSDLSNLSARGIPTRAREELHRHPRISSLLRSGSKFFCNKIITSKETFFDRESKDDLQHGLGYQHLFY